MRSVFGLVGLLVACGVANAHEGTTNRASWEVCDGAELGDLCEFVDSHDALHRGTCRSFDGDLSCVRNQPLIPLAKATATQAGGVPLVTLGLGMGMLACLFGLGFFWRMPTITEGEYSEK